jgi:hypothetical protein
MSLGNLKDQGNQGKNTPYQLAAVQLAGMSGLVFCTEVTITAATPAALVIAINAYYALNKNLYQVSKSIISDGTDYTAFLTIAQLP